MINIFLTKKENKINKTERKFQCKWENFGKMQFYWTWNSSHA